MPSKEENRENWLLALESGKFKQGNAHLREGDCYCCLGVAAEMFCDPTRTDEKRNIYWYEGSSALAPFTVVDALGLYGRTGGIRGLQYNETLAHMNDTGSTFTEIAAFIRANPEKVFRNE